MKTILLKGEERKDLGKSATKQVRAKGMVPCTLYGKQNTENINFSVYHADFKNLVYTPNTYKVRLDVNNSQHEAVLQDLQFHPVSETILHADFLRIDEKTPVTVNIPIRVVGVSPGVRQGGKLRVKIKKLRVKGLIGDMPDFIEVSIDGLKIGQSFKVGQIKLENLEIIDAAANAILSVKTSRTVIASDDEDEETSDQNAEGEAEGSEDSNN